MPAKSIYRSPEGEAEIHAIYDRQLERLQLSYDSCMVDTRFGKTHLLALGPQTAPPLVVLQGGNTTSPTTLGWIKPLIEKYRVYAPDTIGHPGKSAPVRLSPCDESYGGWLVDLLDELDLQQTPWSGAPTEREYSCVLRCMRRSVSAKQSCSFLLAWCRFPSAPCCTFSGGWDSTVSPQRRND